MVGRQRRLGRLCVVCCTFGVGCCYYTVTWYVCGCICAWRV